MRVHWDNEIEKLSKLLPKSEDEARQAKLHAERLQRQLTKLRKRKDVLQEKLSSSDNKTSGSPETSEQSNLLEHENEIEKCSKNDANCLENLEEKPEKEESDEERAQRIASQWIPGDSKGQEKIDQANTDKDEYNQDSEDDEYEYNMMTEDYDLEDIPEVGYYDEIEEVEDVTARDEKSPAGSDTGTNETSYPLDDLEIDIGVIDKIKAWVLNLVSLFKGSDAVERELEKILVSLTALEHEVEKAEQKDKESSTTLKEHKRQHKEMVEKREKYYGPDDVLLPLSEHCFTSIVDKYTYEVCPFKTSSQIENGRKTSLGSWDSSEENDLSSMAFNNGESCWQGPKRSIRVSLSCGASDKLSKVDEPSRCEYTAELTTPVVCFKEYVDDIKMELNRKVEMLNQVLKPKTPNNDEL